MEKTKKKLSRGEEIVKNENSKTRTFVGIPNIIMTCILVFFSLLSIYIVFLSPFDTRVNRASFVGTIVACIYLLYPVSQKLEKKINHIPIYDFILAILSIICYGYFVFNYRQIIDIGIRLTPLMMCLGGLGVILTLEACRRATGVPIVVVASFFIIYGLMNNSLKRVIYDLFYTTEGVIGTPIRACTAFISLFIVFGAFLERTGISDFFINLANSIAGHSVGGPAKAQLILVMSRKAKLYLLDEPIGGVDPATRDYILDTIIRNYNPEAAVVISTHLIADVEQVLDDVIFIDKGRIVLQSSVDDIREERGMSVDQYFREVFRC